MKQNPNYTPGDLVSHDAIGAVITDKQGRILMFKHKKFDFWTIPIGKAEPGQTPYEGLVQELQEECGIKVTNAGEVAVQTYNYMRRGIPVKVTSHIFKVVSYTGKIINNEPHKHPEMKFMILDNVKKLDELSDSTKLYLSQVE